MWIASFGHTSVKGAVTIADSDHINHHKPRKFGGGDLDLSTVKLWGITDGCAPFTRKTIHANLFLLVHKTG